MKIALFGRPFKPEFKPYLEELFCKFDQRKTEIIINDSFDAFLRNELNIEPNIENTYNKPEHINEHIDFLISIGGDGTFLDSVSFVQDKNIPIIGLNSGRLGFLANISKEDISSSIEELYDKKYSFEHRDLISINSNKKQIFPEFPYALNEVTIQKTDSSMITINTSINNIFLTSYWADGVIISTPTGSTAYSMSVGGPIVLPDTQNFIISPIAPHNLSVRPVVLSNNVKIDLSIESRNSSFLISADNRTISLETKEKIHLEKSNFQITVVKFEKNNFLETIRNKLLWGVDKRN